MAYVSAALYSCGQYGHGPTKLWPIKGVAHVGMAVYSYGLYRCCPVSKVARPSYYGVFCYGLDSYGLCGYDLCSYGPIWVWPHTVIVMALYSYDPI